MHVKCFLRKIEYYVPREDNSGEDNRTQERQHRYGRSVLGTGCPMGRFSRVVANEEDERE